MPNHITNIITIKGDEARVREVLDFVKDGDALFSLNKIVPMPETFKKYDTTNHPNGKGLEVGYPVGIEDDGPLVTEELIQEYKLATAEQRVRYGVVGWYDWRIANWGTKWDAYDISKGDDGTIMFCTAWDAPEPVIKALSAKFPDVEIYHAWADEDYGYNCGRCTYEGGNAISVYTPTGGTDYAMEIYFETHPGDEEFIKKNKDGKWEWCD